MPVKRHETLGASMDVGAHSLSRGNSGRMLGSERALSRSDGSAAHDCLGDRAQVRVRRLLAVEERALARRRGRRAGRHSPIVLALQL